MATFSENLRKIRGEAIYGPEMREAIAEAIEQATSDDLIISEIASLLDGRDLYYAEADQIEDTENYILKFLKVV